MFKIPSTDGLRQRAKTRSKLNAVGGAAIVIRPWHNRAPQRVHGGTA